MKAMHIRDNIQKVYSEAEKRIQQLRDRHEPNDK